MRKDYLIISYTALLLVTGACSVQEIDNPESETSPANEIEFVGLFDGPQTKSMIQSDGTILWSRGDAIKVYYGESSTGNYFQAVDTEDHFTAAHFRGTLDAFTGLNESGDFNYFWAVYPYDAAVDCSGNSISARLPHEQIAKAGTFSDNTNISIAKSPGLALSFYNTCSWLRFTVARDDIKSVVFRGNNNEYVAGIFNDTFGDNNKPVPPTVLTGEVEITLSAPEGEYFQTGQLYYLTLLPQVFDNGFSLTFNAENKIGVLNFTNPIEFKRSTYISQENLDSYATFTQVSVINYTSTGGSVWPNNESGLDAPILSSDYDADSGQGSITFSGDLTTIGNNAFAGCRELTSVTVPSTVTTIGDFAFARCSNLESITIPESVTTIGPRAFFNSGLRSISIPKSVTQIGTAALSNCASLASITVDADNTVFDSRNNCNAIIEKTTKTLLFGCSTSTIPNGIVNIGEQAFSYMTGLTSITIPESVTSIGDNAFFSCSKLNQVTSLAIIPPTGSWNIFAQCPIEKIFVRKGALRKYQDNAPWSTYTIEALSY